jgi:hypothetical protein
VSRSHGVGGAEGDVHLLARGADVEPFFIFLLLRNHERYWRVVCVWGIQMGGILSSQAEM